MRWAAGLKTRNLRARVGDDDAVAHAVEDRLQDPGLLAERGLGARQLLGVLLQALVQPADLLELPEARQGPRGVVWPASPAGAGRRWSGSSGEMRGDLERAQHLIAHQRQDDLAADAATTPRRPGRTADRAVESGTTITRPSRTDDGEDVVAVERPHRQLDHAGHRPGRTHRPDHAGIVVDQRDHRQVVAQLGAESQHRIERLVDVVGVQSARSRSGRRRRAGRGRLPGRGSARRSGRSRVA